MILFDLEGNLLLHYTFSSSQPQAVKSTKKHTNLTTKLNYSN